MIKAVFCTLVLIVALPLVIPFAAVQLAWQLATDYLESEEPESETYGLHPRPGKGRA